FAGEQDVVLADAGGAAQLAAHLQNLARNIGAPAVQGSQLGFQFVVLLLHLAHFHTGFGERVLRIRLRRLAGGASLADGALVGGGCVGVASAGGVQGFGAGVGCVRLPAGGSPAVWNRDPSVARCAFRRPRRCGPLVSRSRHPGWRCVFPAIPACVWRTTGGAPRGRRAACPPWPPGSRARRTPPPAVSGIRPAPWPSIPARGLGPGPD